MTDWADSIELRNNGIKCVIDARMASDLLRTIISFCLIAGALLFYSWTRSQIVEIGYQDQKLFESEQMQLEIQKQLIVEEAHLKDPGRIELIATRDLDMVKLPPSRMILPPLEKADRNISESLAMAGSEEENLEKSGEGKDFRDYVDN